MEKLKFCQNDLYISNSINSKSNCISWSKWLACGMSKSVVLIDQSSTNAKIIHQFTEHQSIVTCVYWISDEILISSDDSSNVIIWHFDSVSGRVISFSKHRVESLNGPIIDLSGLSNNNNIYMICASESNVELLVYKSGFHCIQTINYQPFFVISVNLLDLNGVLLVSLGLDDGRVLCHVMDINDGYNGDLSAPLVLSGHEDWVTSLDSIKHDSNSAYLASSSQDSFIRVWKISTTDLEQNPSSANQLDVQKLQLPGNIRLCICLDGVLSGHENWVTSVQFCERGELRGGIGLMSASMDKSMIIWSQDKEDNWQWMEETRLGQIGGNTLGFIGGAINSVGDLIIGYGYQGDCVVYALDGNRWETTVNIGGHFDCVEDLAWDMETGRYLLSVGKDQTVRLHAPWIHDNGPLEWHEIGRPQIHGYDMTSVASIDSVTFVTGADEKIARVFAMNNQFNEYFHRICRTRFHGDRLRDEIVSSDALGLSNKSLEPSAHGDHDFISSNVPKEENISGRTLWPELTKLYGHVYEVFRISSHVARGIVATSCKSQLPEYADIILWDAQSWSICQRLPFHKSTVVRVQFNRAGNKIVSVSKDRQWALWHNIDTTQVNFQLVNHSTKSNCHSKIIWDVDWTADDRCFVTVSRDKRMIIWDSDNCARVGEPLTLKESINAIATMPILLENLYVFAIGLENGEIKIVQFDLSTNSWTTLLSFVAHFDWITRLRFNPVPNENKFLLASCSKDRFVKIFEINQIE